VLPHHHLQVIGRDAFGVGEVEALDLEEEVVDLRVR
jgi:hypothetical protein